MQYSQNDGGPEGPPTSGIETGTTGTRCLPELALEIINALSRPRFGDVYAAYLRLNGHKWPKLREGLGGKSGVAIAAAVRRLLEADSSVLAARRAYEDYIKSEECARGHAWERRGNISTCTQLPDSPEYKKRVRLAREVGRAEWWYKVMFRDLAVAVDGPQAYWRVWPADNAEEALDGAEEALDGAEGSPGR